MIDVVNIYLTLHAAYTIKPKKLIYLSYHLIIICYAMAMKEYLYLDHGRQNWIYRSINGLLHLDKQQRHMVQELAHQMVIVHLLNI